MAKYGVYQGRQKKKSGYVTKGTGSSTIRKRRAPTYSRGGKKWEMEKLIRETKKDINKANARLKSLQRRYKSGTWATRKLAERLNNETLKAWSKSGRISVKGELKKMTKTQLTALKKSIKNFLASDTSTKKGIKKRIESVKGGIEELLAEPGKDFTSEDADFFYSMLEDKDFTTLSDEDYASTIWACIDDAIEFEDTEDNFVKRIEMYAGINMQDLDKREKAEKLYQKYIL